MTQNRSLAIGETVKALRKEFPEVTVSKIRFLESKGMVMPHRTQGGYRRFDQADLARLRYILRQQRDHFLPLKVIKAKLASWERGDDPDEPQGLGASLWGESGEPITRADLLRRSGLTDAQLNDLIENRVMAVLPGQEDDPVFPPEAGIIAVEAKVLMSRGLEGRHLRSIRLAVDTEVALYRSVSGPLLRVQWMGEGGEHVRDMLVGMADALASLHRALLLASLRAELHR